MVSEKSKRHGGMLFSLFVLSGLCLSMFVKAPVSAAAPTLAAGSTQDVKGHLLGWKETFDRVKKLKGRVVVIDVWSTFCVPCMREYPHLVKLQKEHPRDVVCVSININYDGLDAAPTSEMQQQVMKFLAKKESKLINIVCTDPDEEIYKQVKFASIPAVYVFDKNGKLRKLFYNDDNEYGKEGFGYEKDILPLVDQLMAEQVNP